MEKRESEIVEFKKSLSELKQGVISLASMLNKKGKGTLYFGVLNDGTVVGQAIGKNTTHDISIEIKNRIRPSIIPSIEVKEVKGKSYIEVKVEGDDAPYSAYSRYYIRSDDEDLIIEENELAKMFEKKSPDYAKWEETLSEYSLEAIDEKALIDYFFEAEEARRISFGYKDLRSAITRLGLYKDEKLNNAGVYLFSNLKPIKLKEAVFNTDERISFSDMKLFEGNIFECIGESLRFLSSSLRWRVNIVGSKRVEEMEVPIEAIREIVVNAFTHAKYSSRSVLHEIIITPSYIKITSPGNIIGGIDPLLFAKGEKGPFPRNPLIAMTLYRNKTIESFATGFSRTFSLCDEKGISYKYESDDYSFSFTFFRKQIDDRDKSREKMKVSNNMLILDMLKKKPSSGRETLSKELGLSTATISREMKTLQTLGLIERVGSKKTGYWKVKEP